MDLAEFRRAYLCQWPEVAKPGWDVIAQDAWGACAEPGGAAVSGEVAFACRSASMHVSSEGPAASRRSSRRAGSRSGRVVVDLVWYGHPSGAVARLAELSEKHDPLAVVVDAGSQSGTLLRPLADAGVWVTSPTARDVAVAHGEFLDLVHDGRSGAPGSAAVDGGGAGGRSSGPWRGRRRGTGGECARWISRRLVGGDAGACTRSSRGRCSPQPGRAWVDLDATGGSGVRLSVVLLVAVPGRGAGRGVADRPVGVRPVPDRRLRGGGCVGAAA